MRTLTTTLRLDGGAGPLIPVRSTDPIPKECLREAMEALRTVRAAAPVKAGECLAEKLLSDGTLLAMLAETDA